MTGNFWATRKNLRRRQGRPSPLRQMTHIPPSPTRSSTSSPLLSRPSSLLSFPPLRSRSAVSSPSGSGQSPAAKRYLVHFRVKNASGEINFKGTFTKNMSVFSLFTSNNAASVAARGCLPPGAKVCVAATANQISSAIRVFSGFRTWGCESTLGGPLLFPPLLFPPLSPPTYHFQPSLP